MVDFGFNSAREREGSDKYLIRASSLTGLEGAPLSVIGALDGQWADRRGDVAGGRIRLACTRRERSKELDEPLFIDYSFNFCFITSLLEIPLQQS